MRVRRKEGERREEEEEERGRKRRWTHQCYWNNRYRRLIVCELLLLFSSLPSVHCRRVVRRGRREGVREGVREVPVTMPP